MAAIGKNAHLCETCGSTIDESSVDLGCMVCLLDAGLDAEAEQIDESCASPPGEVGAYTIEHRVDGSFWELGHGAMGVTYRAIDKAPRSPSRAENYQHRSGSHSAEARERFMREARAAAALRHPNVATVYQFGVREATGQFFYAMELVEGETLEERVRRLGPLDVLTTIDIALQVTAALEAAEERGLVHRDLKPGNLMLVSEDGALDLVGFKRQRDEACARRRRTTARRWRRDLQCQSHRLRRRQSGGGENERDGAHARRLCGDTGVCQSGTIHKCACRCALGHLFVRRDALVLADRSHAFQRPDHRRDSRRAPIEAFAHRATKSRARSASFRFIADVNAGD